MVEGTEVARPTVKVTRARAKTKKKKVTPRESFEPLPYFDSGRCAWVAYWPSFFSPFSPVASRLEAQSLLVEFKSDVFAMLSDIGVGRGDSRCRDVFPIPLLSVPVVANPNLSRSVRQRIKQDIASTKRANEAIDVLNDLFSFHEDLVNHGSNSSICSDHIKKCMREYSPVDTVMPEEALSSLLGKSHSYTEDVASSTLVSFQPGQQSLPAVSSLPSDMRRILDTRASHTLESFEKEMMLDQTAFSELITGVHRSEIVQQC